MPVFRCVIWYEEGGEEDYDDEEIENSQSLSFKQS